MARRPARTAADFLPPERTLEALRAAAPDCRGCDLYRDAEQVVFGEGPVDAALMLVGEIPGTQEDRAGRPFVGPAGRLLDLALAEAGLDRGQVYVTNAVKHFKGRVAAGRRVVAAPGAGEIRACRPWLEAEIAAVRPRLIVCLGATAGRSLLGPGFRVTQQRGALLDSRWGAPVLATLHPAAVLRSPDRDAAFAGLVADLRRAAAALRAP